MIADDESPLAGYEDAALDLAVDVDALGRAIERFVEEQQRLLAAHLDLVRVARLVVQAYHAERLDGSLLEMLDVAVTQARR